MTGSGAEETGAVSRIRADPSGFLNQKRTVSTGIYKPCFFYFFNFFSFYFFFVSEVRERSSPSLSKNDFRRASVPPLTPWSAADRRTLVDSGEEKGAER